MFVAGRWIWKLRKMRYKDCHQRKLLLGRYLWNSLEIGWLTLFKKNINLIDFQVFLKLANVALVQKKKVSPCKTFFRPVNMLPPLSEVFASGYISCYTCSIFFNNLFFNGKNSDVFSFAEDNTFYFCENVLSLSLANLAHHSKNLYIGLEWT